MFVAIDFFALRKRTDFFSAVKIENTCSIIKTYIINIIAQIVDHGYTLKPPRLGGSTIYVLDQRVKPCIPQFYCIKVGFNGYSLHGHIIRTERHLNKNEVIISAVCIQEFWFCTFKSHCITNTC